MADPTITPKLGDFVAGPLEGSDQSDCRQGVLTRIGPDSCTIEGLFGIYTVKPDVVVIPDHNLFASSMVAHVNCVRRRLGVPEVPKRKRGRQSLNAYKRGLTP
jgi:hypothetical protein